MKPMYVVDKILEILRDNCEDPADEIVKLGKVLQEIGEVLRGSSLADARATMKAIEALVPTMKPHPPEATAALGRE